MDFDYILPACFVETQLMKVLGFPSKNHQNGDGQVINILDKNLKIPNNRILIGVMDKAVGTNPSHVPNNYITVEDGPQSICLKRKPNSRRYIIFINHVFEDWIKIVGDSKKISRPYMNNNGRFNDEMKKSNLDKNRTLTSYFEEINKSNPPSFKKIKDWINKINNNEI